MTNHPNHDAALALASTVGTNVRTLRKNKRDLGRNLVLAAAVEGFAWTNLWTDAKKAAKFATMDKPEQNQFNVFGSALKTIILAWPSLDDATKADFAKGEIVFSTLVTTIKEAEKNADKKEAERQAAEDAGKEASQQPDPRDQQQQEETPPPVVVSPLVEAVNVITGALNLPMDDKSLTPGEVAALRTLLDEVAAFRQRVLDHASGEAANG